jgi:hypothetical protein
MLSMKGWGRTRADVVAISSELTFVPVDDAEDTYLWKIVGAGDALVGGMRVLVNDRVRVGIGFGWASVVDDAVISRIMHELDRLAADHPDLPVFVNVQDALIRHRLREAGYTGALRERLRRGPPLERPVDPIEQLCAFVPHLDVVAHLNSRRALRLEVGAEGIPGTLDVGMPRRPMFVEEVAACLDTVFALKRALAPMADCVHRVFFGDSKWGEPPAARWAGLAHGDGRFTVDGNQVFVDDVVALRRARQEQRSPISNVAAVPLPYTKVDGITAHEVWHLVDREIVRSGLDYVTFHHALGEPLGVETLEAALRGRRDNADPEMRRAAARLALQVSLYATTNRREATAEMFERWWCSDGDHHRPVVARFGELVEERLGRPVHPTTSASV